MKKELKKFVLKGISVLFCLVILNVLNAQRVDVQAVSAIIKTHQKILALSDGDIRDMRISDAYIDAASGITMVYMQQTYMGYDVLNSIQTLALNKNVIASFTGKRISIPFKNNDITTAKPLVSPVNAVIAALKHLQLTPVIVNNAINKLLPEVYEFGNLGIASNNIKSTLVWVRDVKSKKLFLTWQVAVQPLHSSDYWLVKVDAKNASILGKDNLTVYCNFDTDHDPATFDHTFNQIPGENYSTNTSNNNAGYRVIKFPSESPIHPGGAPSIHINPWELAPANSKATTLKWHDDGNRVYDSTRGNNVLAQDDKNGNNGFGSSPHSQTGEPDFLFDFTPDFTQNPNLPVNLSFATTNLFYWNNIMHDLSYLYGFDEPAGNFQANNLGRGGAGNDYVLADAQDGSGTSNANFSTPSDGQTPRMQMFLFTGNPKLDGDLDNGVIAHEYTHGISNRLTGGPSNPTCLQNSEQMGEGWSDYFALMVTTDWSTATINDGTKKRTIGTYVNNEKITGNGFRTRPYSTDITINNLTYDNVTKQSESFFDSHFIGEVWCEALWEMTWALIETNGISKNLHDADALGGNNVALKLVMLGMKLQTCSPGFIDGRDAILKADTILYSGVHTCTIWKAFAKRGMGQFAYEGSPYSLKDGRADFNEHNFAIVTKAADKSIVGQNENIQYTFTLTSQCAAISNYTITDTLPHNLTYVSGGTYNGADNTVSFTAIDLPQNSSATFSLIATTKTGTYFATQQHLNETIPANTIPAAFSVTKTGKSNWQVSNKLSHSSGFSLFANEVDSTSSAYLETTNVFSLSGISTLSFWHYFNTEGGYDGGWLEISTDTGKTWQYIDPSLFILNPYNNNMLVGARGNRYAFAGLSTGFIQSTVNLSKYSGKSIKLRFAFSCDVGTSFDGWYIDDILLESAAGIYNSVALFDGEKRQVSNSSAISMLNEEVLPITWGNFTATAQNQTSLLKWTVVQEINSSKYIIERSTDAVNFLRIGEVMAKGGNSVVNNYSFTDNYPLNGDDHYRIKQVDADGKYSYSEVRKVSFSDLKALISISPNPARDLIKVTITGNTEKLIVKLYNAGGQQVTSANMYGQYITLNIAQLPPAVYYIKITGGNLNYVQKLIKH